MRKFIAILFAGVIGIIPGINAAHAHGLEFDTSDPLFMMQTRDILSETSLTYWDNILRLQQTLSYGITTDYQLVLMPIFNRILTDPRMDSVPLIWAVCIVLARPPGTVRI